jgi:hypothetical protein
MEHIIKNKKKALHITNHQGTTRNMNSVIHMLNSEGVTKIQLTTMKCDFPFFISTQDTSAIWKSYKDIVCGGGYDYLIFTDTTMYSRPFLQFINDHKAKIVIYITNRFDWGMWGFVDMSFYHFYSSLSHSEDYKDRIVFCADNKYDQFYASLYNIRFFYDDNIRLTPPLLELEQEEFLMPLEKNREDSRLFVYNRGTKIEKYAGLLDSLGVSYDVFGPSPDKSYLNEAHICEYLGYLHLPYQVNIQSLWENLGAYVIYFIPSLRFIKELLATTEWYYWEEKSGKSYYNVEMVEKSIDLSEWYCEENACLFEYFDSWSDLKEILVDKYSDDEYIYKKKDAIRNYMIESNKVNINKWKDIFI